MPDPIMLMVFGRPARRVRRTKRARRRAQYRDPMADVTRATMGGVTVLVGVAAGTTVLKAIRG